MSDSEAATTAPTPTPQALLTALEAAKTEHGKPATRARIKLIEALGTATFPAAKLLHRYHEVLCFLRAYPGDRAELAAVDAALDGFSERADLKPFKEELADSGIAGTTIHYRFYWPTARWLAERWPSRLRIDWDAIADTDRMKAALPVLLTPAESSTVRTSELAPKALFSKLCAPGESDGNFLVRRVASLPGDDRVRESFFDTLDPALRLEPARGVPSRTLARHEGGKLRFRTEPLRSERPNLAREIRRAPGKVKKLSEGDAQAIIDLANGAMVTRGRDLEAFGFADRNDVYTVDDEAGLSFAFIGVVPERRLLLRAAYGVLTIKNNVPIGYVQVDSLMKSSEISYNTFESFRGAEASWVLGRLLAACKSMFGAQSFSVEPYQLGVGNDEGIESGAWWFYYKLGFRPSDKKIQAIADAEEKRMARSPKHRSNKATLEKLARGHLHFSVKKDAKPQDPSLTGLGWAVSDVMGERFAGDREIGARALADELRERLELETWGATTEAEAGAVLSLAPVFSLLPGLDKWSPREKKALGRIMLAKGGASEQPYVKAFDAHPKLGEAVLTLNKRFL